MAETKGAAHSDECEKADGGICLCSCGGTRHGVKLRTGKLRKMGNVKVTKARVGGKDAARVVDTSTGRPPGGGTKREKARAPEKPAAKPSDEKRTATSASSGSGTARREFSDRDVLEIMRGKNGTVTEALRTLKDAGATHEQAAKILKDLGAKVDPDPNAGRDGAYTANNHERADFRDNSDMWSSPGGALRRRIENEDKAAAEAKRTQTLKNGTPALYARLLGEDGKPALTASTPAVRSVVETMRENGWVVSNADNYGITWSSPDGAKKLRMSRYGKPKIYDARSNNISGKAAREYITGGADSRDQRVAARAAGVNVTAATTPAVAKPAGTPEPPAAKPATTPERAATPAGGALADMSPDDQQRIRNAVADRGPGIYTSPMVGGSRSDVGRYLAEGELGRQLADRHDWRKVWQAVSQVIDEDPSVLERSPQQVKADTEARNERVDAIAKQANEAAKAKDLPRAAALLDEAAAIDPDRQAYGRRVGEVRDLIRKRAGEQDTAGKPAATQDAPTAKPSGSEPGGGGSSTGGGGKPQAKPVIADGMGSRMFTPAQRALLARIAAGEQVDKHPSRAALLKMRALVPDGDGVKVNPALIDMPETPGPEKATVPARPNAAPEATRELLATADKLATSVPGQRPIVGDKSAHDIVRQLHDDVRSGKVTPERAAERLDQIATNLYSDIGFDLVDAARKIRGDKLSPPRPDQNGTMRDAGWLDAADLRPVKERTGGWGVHSRPSAANPAGTSQRVATKAAALEWIDRAAKTRRFWVGLGPNPDARTPDANGPDGRNQRVAARAAEVQVRTNKPAVSDKAADAAEWPEVMKRVTADFGLVDHDKAKVAAKREARTAHGLPTVAEAAKLTKARGMSDEAEAKREQGDAAEAVYAAVDKVAGLRTGLDNNRRQVEAAQRELARGNIRPANAAKLREGIDRLNAGEGPHRERIAEAERDLAAKVAEWQAGPEGRAAMRAERERIADEQRAAAEAARREQVVREVRQKAEAEEDAALASLEEARRKAGDLNLRSLDDARALAERVGLKPFNLINDGNGNFGAAFQNARGERVANYDSRRGWYGNAFGEGAFSDDRAALILASDARNAYTGERLHQVGEVLRKAEKARTRQATALPTPTDQPTTPGGDRPRGVTGEPLPGAPRRLPDAQHSALQTLGEGEGARAVETVQTGQIKPVLANKLGVKRATAVALEKRGLIRRSYNMLGDQVNFTDKGYAYLAAHRGDAVALAILADIASVERKVARLRDEATKLRSSDRGPGTSELVRLTRQEADAEEARAARMRLTLAQRFRG